MAGPPTHHALCWLRDQPAQVQSDRDDFAWAKQYGGLRRMMRRELDKVDGLLKFTMATFNLL